MRCGQRSVAVLPTWMRQQRRSRCSIRSSAARIKRSLTTVIDTLGLDPERRGTTGGSLARPGFLQCW